MDNSMNQRDVRKEILEDLHSVAPYKAPWKRVLKGYLPWAVALAVIVSLVTGIRTDYAQVGFWWSWGVSSLFLAAAFALAVAAVRESIPAAAVPKIYTFGLFALIMGAQVTAAGLLHAHHPCPAHGNDSLRLTIICSIAICGIAITWGAILVYLMTRGMSSRVDTMMVLAGGATVIAAEALWRLHCPYTDLWHLLTAHFPPYLIMCGIGIWAVRFARKRRRSGP